MQALHCSKFLVQHYSYLAHHEFSTKPAHYVRTYVRTYLPVYCNKFPTFVIIWPIGFPPHFLSNIACKRALKSQMHVITNWEYPIRHTVGMHTHRMYPLAILWCKEYKCSADFGGIASCWNTSCLNFNISRHIVYLYDTIDRQFLPFILIGSCLIW